MDLTGFLEERSQATIDEATGAIARVEAPHYQMGVETRERFESLLRVLGPDIPLSRDPCARTAA